MAIETQWFFGLETGGAEELQFLGGSVITSPAPWSPKETYLVQLGWKAQFDSPRTFNMSGWWVTTSFNIRFSSGTKDVNNDFFVIAEAGSGLKHLRLRVPGGSNGNLYLVHANGSVLVGESDVFSDNTWYRVTVKVKLTNAGDCYVWVSESDRVHGSPTLSVSSQDFYHDSATTSTIQMRWNNSWPTGAPNPTVYVSNGYCRKDDGGAIDTNDTVLGPFVIVGPYNDTNQGIASQYGDNLYAGLWSRITDVPVVDGDLAEFRLSLADTTDEGGITADDGDHSGPFGDPDVDGTLIAMSGVFRAKRSSTQMPITFWGKLGIAAPGDVGIDRTIAVNFGALTTSLQNFIVFFDLADSEHAKSRYAQIGMKAQSTDGFIATEAQLAMGAVFMLHEEPLGRLRLHPGMAGGMSDTVGGMRA